jgi:hypothetical protein
VEVQDTGDRDNVVDLAVGLLTVAVNPQGAGVLQVMGSKPRLDVACVPIPALEDIF